jgi:aspartyl-tRNA(Asn)/glutamyl-tRNA(Gln) amidotransferase subunit C
VYDFALIFQLRHDLPNMSLTRADIDKIAHLARLALAEGEVPGYVESLSRIIDTFGELDRAATAGVAPMSHPLPGLVQRMRADAVSESDRRELYQHNAPEARDGLYLVPRVIE